jgi:hypothetical protein
MRYIQIALIVMLLSVASLARPVWQVGLDSEVRFYQPTDFGIILAATERSLYAIDGMTGERLWRRETGRINETAITPVPGTDLVLFSRDLGSKSRLEAVDIISGESIWRTEKFKGDVLQLAADPELNLLAVVMVKDTRGTVRQRDEARAGRPHAEILDRRRALEKDAQERCRDDAGRIRRRLGRDLLYTR